MADFTFTNEHSNAQVAGIIDVLRRPRLYIPTHQNYPDFSEWLERTEADLQTGKKRAMAAYMGKTAVGSIVYRQSEEDVSVMDIRNISVTPDARGRYIGSFLLRNCEIEGAVDFAQTRSVRVDTKVANSKMVNFLKEHGYSIDTVTDLYGFNNDDVVLSKKLTPLFE
jgi:ribosomal protein S18 acetylase RimI-like enzyme